MEATIYIEIPVNITFDIDPGQKQTRWEPGYPPQVEDIDYDPKQVLEAINEAIFGKDSTIDEDLMAEAEKIRERDEEYYAEIAYEALKEARKPCPF